MRLSTKGRVHHELISILSELHRLLLPSCGGSSKTTTRMPSGVVSDCGSTFRRVFQIKNTNLRIIGIQIKKNVVKAVPFAKSFTHASAL